MKTFTLVIGLLMFGLFSSFTLNNGEEVFNIKFSSKLLDLHFQKLNQIKQLVDRSNLPHQEVVFIVASIDSLQNDIISQIRQQLPKK